MAPDMPSPVTDAPQPAPSAPAVRPVPALLMRRSAGGRGACTGGGPISQFVKYCCPI